MQVGINKTVVIEMHLNEAFAVKSFIEVALKEIKQDGLAEVYFSKAKKLVDMLEENGV